MGSKLGPLIFGNSQIHQVRTSDWEAPSLHRGCEPGAIAASSGTGGPLPSLEGSAVWGAAVLEVVYSRPIVGL